ncbi:MAG: dTMP kinase [Planctomycetota bacterium]
MFLVLEGIDGCGKSTQAKVLVAELEQRGKETLHLREPGGTALGDTLRQLILSLESGVEIHSRAEALLYSAARAELVRGVIRPALAAGKWVVCERFHYSTLSYQGYGLGEDLAHLRALSDYATEMTRPDRVILLDVDPAIALARVGKSLDRIESRGLEYMRRVRDGYLYLAGLEPERFRTVDAGGTSEECRAAVLETLADVLP